MNVFDLLVGLVVGSLWLRYLFRCGEWLWYRRWIIYPTVPLWWGVYFCMVIGWNASYETVILGLVHHGLLSLVLAPPRRLDRQNPYTYLDAYEQFRQSRRIIIGTHGLTYVACNIWNALSQNSLIHSAIPIGIQWLLLGLAWQTDHKGYQLLWVLLALSTWLVS